MDRYSVMIDDDLSTCRICLDDKSDEVLFSPCRCSGSSKYVHRSCLNKWRTEDLSNRNSCEICLYDYQTEKYDRSKFIKFGYYNDRTAGDVIFRYNICLTLLTVIITNLIDSIDKNNICISWIINDSSTLEDYTRMLVYLNVTTVTELSLYVFYIILGSLCINNRLEYYKLLGAEFSLLIIMFLIVSGTIFLTGNYDISLTMFYFTNYLISFKHIKTVYNLNNFCPDRVKEYDLDDDI